MLDVKLQDLLPELVCPIGSNIKLCRAQQYTLQFIPLDPTPGIQLQIVLTVKVSSLRDQKLFRIYSQYLPKNLKILNMLTQYFGIKEPVQKRFRLLSVSAKNSADFRYVNSVLWYQITSSKTV